jgi:hypothetical protein
MSFEYDAGARKMETKFKVGDIVQMMVSEGVYNESRGAPLGALGVVASLPEPRSYYVIFIPGIKCLCYEWEIKKVGEATLS